MVPLGASTKKKVLIGEKKSFEGRLCIKNSASDREDVERGQTRPKQNLAFHMKSKSSTVVGGGGGAIGGAHTPAQKKVLTASDWIIAVRGNLPRHQMVESRENCIFRGYDEERGG